MGYTQAQMNVPKIVAAFFGISVFCSLLSSFLTLFLIRQVFKRQAARNTFLTIVTFIALGQAVYEITLIVVGFYQLLYPLAFQEAQFTNSSAFLSFSFVSTSLWTNVLSCILLYVVITKRAVNVSKHFAFYCCIVYLPSLLVAIAFFIPQATSTRMATRVDISVRGVSILVNLVLYAIMTARVYQMKLHESETSSGRAIFVLTRKMKYYALILIASRLFSSWYELGYDIRLHYSLTPTSDDLRNFVVCMAALLTPSAGVGYLIVFLVFQPVAREYFFSYVLKMACFSTSKHIEQEQRRQHQQRIMDYADNKDSICSRTSSASAQEEERGRSIDFDRDEQAVAKGARGEQPSAILEQTSGGNEAIRFSRLEEMDEEELQREIDAAT